MLGATVSPAAPTKEPVPVSFFTVTVKVWSLPTSLVLSASMVIWASTQVLVALGLSPGLAVAQGAGDVHTADVDGNRGANRADACGGRADDDGALTQIVGGTRLTGAAFRVGWYGAGPRDAGDDRLARSWHEDAGLLLSSSSWTIQSPPPQADFAPQTSVGSVDLGSRRGEPPVCSKTKPWAPPWRKLSSQFPMV